MNYLGVYLTPNLLEEGRRELERQRELQRQIEEARAARRADRPSRFAALAARLRQAPRPDARRPAVEGC